MTQLQHQDDRSQETGKIFNSAILKERDEQLINSRRNCGKNSNLFSKKIFSTLKFAHLVYRFTDRFFVNNVTYHHESSLPQLEIVSDKNKVIGIKVSRQQIGHKSEVLYERTGRSASKLIDAPTGELHFFLKTSAEFIFKNRQKKILDVGCGNGNFVLDLKKADPKLSITGLDLYLSPEQKKNTCFIEGDAFALPFANESFDVLISTWSVFTYESTQNMPVLLNEMTRVLKPNGSLIVGPFLEFDQISQFFRLAQRLNLLVAINPQSNVVSCKKLI